MVTSREVRALARPLNTALASWGKSSPDASCGIVCTPSCTAKTNEQAENRAAQAVTDATEFAPLTSGVVVALSAIPVALAVFPPVAPEALELAVKQAAKADSEATERVAEIRYSLRRRCRKRRRDSSSDDNSRTDAMQMADR